MRSGRWRDEHAARSPFDCGSSLGTIRAARVDDPAPRTAIGDGWRWSLRGRGVGSTRRSPPILHFGGDALPILGASQ
jgi:hypothetical protein